MILERLLSLMGELALSWNVVVNTAAPVRGTGQGLVRQIFSKNVTAEAKVAAPEDIFADAGEMECADAIANLISLPLRSCC